MMTATVLRRADAAYAVLFVGPLVAFILGAIPPADVLPSVGSTVAFYASILLLWGSLLVGGFLALGCRWNRPLFALGLLAVVIGLTSIITNVLNYSAGLLREGMIGTVLTVTSGIAVVLYPLAVLALAVVWYGFSRRRWASTSAGRTA
jgi:hypothetical protein